LIPSKGPIPFHGGQERAPLATLFSTGSYSELQGGYIVFTKDTAASLEPHALARWKFRKYALNLNPGLTYNILLLVIPIKLFELHFLIYKLGETQQVYQVAG
jgi:hypothetical protein